MEEIYLDNNATTALDERVLEAMLPWLREGHGNPSSLHARGERAAGGLSAARSSVARLVGAASPREIVFTSGGTESNHAAIHTTLTRGAERGRGRVLTSAIEHAGLLRPLEAAADRGGFAVERIGVDPRGAVDLDRLHARIEALGEELALVSIMWANNETGVRLADEELRGVGEACRRVGAPFHVDAVQAPGKLPMDVAGLGIDLASISAHKLHGPQGIGALYVRAAHEAAEGFTPLFAGGAQEGGRRAGTPNVAGIVGLGRAAELALERVSNPAEVARVAGLRDRLERGLAERIPGVSVVATEAPRLPNTANLRFESVAAELLLPSLAAEGLAVSAGAACSAGTHGPSHVLLAMGLDEAAAASCLRFSLSWRTTEEEIDAAVDRVSEVAGALRAL